MCVSEYLTSEIELVEILAYSKIMNLNFQNQNFKKYTINNLTLQNFGNSSIQNFKKDKRSISSNIHWLMLVDP